MSRQTLGWSNDAARTSPHTGTPNAHLLPTHELIRESQHMRVARFTATTALLGSACAASTAALVSLGVHGAAASTPTAIAIVGPAGSGTFGDDVLVLSNDNFIVTESMFSRPTAANVGAAYLYSGPDQHLVSTLTGLQAGDRIGRGGLQEVANSNFVVESSHWHNGAAADAEVVTWIDGAAGLNANWSEITMADAGAVTDRDRHHGSCRRPRRSAIATTAVLNMTVTNPAAPGFVTVYPCGIDPPLASNPQLQHRPVHRQRHSHQDRNR
jgi:hypothetical protein